MPDGAQCCPLPPFLQRHWQGVTQTFYIGKGRGEWTIAMMSSFPLLIVTAS
jgi:hypothetical protein